MMINKKIFLILVLLALVSPVVESFSINPTTRLSYDEGLEQEIFIRVNSKSNEVKVIEASLRGELAEYMDIQESISLNPGQSKSIPVQINIPVIEDLMGTNFVRVDFLEKIDDEQQAMFATRIQLVHRIEIEFPYPGQYVDITDLKVSDVNEGMDVDYSWELTGRGELLTHYEIMLEVSDREEILLTKDLGTGSISRDEKIRGSGLLRTGGFLPGNYILVKTVKFAGENNTRLERFTIGEEDVSLISIKPEVLAAESMNFVEISVMSLWTEEFSNVHARIEVLDKVVRTPSESLRPLGEATLAQYLDARDVVPGEYEANITIVFDDFEKTFQEIFNFSEDSDARVERPQNFYRNLILFLTILLLIAMFGLIYLVFAKEK